MSLYLFRSFFFFFCSIKSRSLEPLRLGDWDETEAARLPLRSGSSSSVGSLSMEAWLQRLVGSDESDPRLINAGRPPGGVRFEVLALSTSLLLKSTVDNLAENHPLETIHFL